MTDRIRDLKGFGPKSEEIFAKIGIFTAQDFLEQDPYLLYARLKKEVKGTGLNSLYAMIGAREGIHWLEVPKRYKTEILMRLDDMGIAPK